MSGIILSARGQEYLKTLADPPSSLVAALARIRLDLPPAHQAQFALAATDSEAVRQQIYQGRRAYIRHFDEAPPYAIEVLDALNALYAQTELEAARSAVKRRRPYDLSKALGSPDTTTRFLAHLLLLNQQLRVANLQGKDAHQDYKPAALVEQITPLDASLANASAIWHYLPEAPKAVCWHALRHFRGSWSLLVGRRLLVCPDMHAVARARLWQARADLLLAWETQTTPGLCFTLLEVSACTDRLMESVSQRQAKPSFEQRMQRFIAGAIARGMKLSKLRKHVRAEFDREQTTLLYQVWTADRKSAITTILKELP